MHASANQKLKKSLGLADVYAISTGAMFSSGFFLLPGIAALEAGSAVSLAYLVAGILIIPAMLSVAELSTAMPRAGGAYFFLDRAMGPLVGTVGGLGTWLALVLKSAFALIGMGAYLAIVLDVPIKPLAVALTIVFAVINIFGAKESSRLQRILVYTLLAVLTYFLAETLLTIFTVQDAETTWSNLGDFAPKGLGGFLATVGLVFVSYAGLTKVASVAEEVRDPDRNLPLGMFLSLATATLVYVAGAFAMNALLTPETFGAELAPVAAAAEVGIRGIPTSVAITFIVIAAVAAFASTGNAGIMASSRYPLAMARDGLVSPRFGRLSRFGTPTLGILVSAALMIFCIVALDIAAVAKLASAFQLVLFGMLNVAVIVMRESRIAHYKPGFRSPLYPWLQIAGVLIPIALIAQMGAVVAALTAAVMLAAAAWYLVYARHRVNRTGAIYHVFERLARNTYRGLDGELRAIVAEKGLLQDDPLEQAVREARVLDLETAEDLPAVLGQAAAEAALRHGLDAAALTAALEAELADGLLPITHGVALPHLHVPELQSPELILVRVRRGVSLHPSQHAPVAGPDGWATAPVHAVLFLMSPAGDPAAHLRLVADLASRIGDDTFLTEWLEDETPAQLRATLLNHRRFVSIRAAEGELTGMRIGEIQLPVGATVALLERGDALSVPRPHQRVEPDDRLTIIGHPEVMRLVRKRFEPQEGGS